jgi:hypothetical protein
MDRLIKKIRRLGLGCHVLGKFLGIFVYADDIFLLCPSRSGLQAMVTECQEFAKENNLVFSVNSNPEKSKTKCIIFNKKSIDTTKVPQIMLDKDPLPWVHSLKHLGVTLETDNSMSIDISQKRGSFIGKIYSLRQEFHFVKPSVLMKIFSIYTLSFYGSALWNLFSKECKRIYSSYNILVRTTFGLPREAHRYFIESVSESSHVQVLMASRLVKFHNLMLQSKRPEITLLATMNEKDSRTRHGNNLLKITIECDTNIEDIASQTVKENMKFFHVPQQDEWKISIVNELLKDQSDHSHMNEFDRNDRTEML